MGDTSLSARGVWIEGAEGDPVAAQEFFHRRGWTAGRPVVPPTPHAVRAHLEWAGLAPALFSRELGIKGELGDARREVRNNGGDLSPLFSVITSAQQYGLDFCAELAARQ